jgi:hypothetical protein
MEENSGSEAVCWGTNATAEAISAAREDNGRTAWWMLADSDEEKSDVIRSN